VHQCVHAVPCLCDHCHRPEPTAGHRPRDPRRLRSARRGTVRDGMYENYRIRPPAATPSVRFRSGIPVQNGRRAGARARGRPGFGPGNVRGARGFEGAHQWIPQEWWAAIGVSSSCASLIRTAAPGSVATPASSRRAGGPLRRRAEPLLQSSPCRPHPLLESLGSRDGGWPGRASTGHRPRWHDRRSSGLVLQARWTSPPRRRRPVSGPQTCTAQSI
jgi:hypothetical protein